MQIAAEICIFTNDRLTFEELEPTDAPPPRLHPRRCDSHGGASRRGGDREPDAAPDRRRARQVRRRAAGRPSARWRSPCATAGAASSSPPELAEEIAPKNILMIGPTGVGKTEIARRLAKLAKAPFLKVEASKFTEVGYVGRDVESMVRDLVEIAVGMVREEKREAVRESRRRARRGAPAPAAGAGDAGAPDHAGLRSAQRGADDERRARRRRARSSATSCAPARSTTAGRDRGRRVSSIPSFEMFTPQGVEEVGVNIKDMLPGLFGAQDRSSRSPVRRGARDPAAAGGGEADRPPPGRRARRATASSRPASIFLDEIDKIAGREGGPRPRRLARGRAARPAADRRGHHGVDQVRHGEDRPHPVHRRRRLPRQQAVGPDPRAPGPLPDPRRARRR